MHYMRRNVLVVFGTRPEAIKLAPVILELRKTKKYNVIVCNTEQQKELSNQTLSYFGITANYKLDVMGPNQTLVDVQCKIMKSLVPIFENKKIDATIVQGDTITVLATSLVSFYHKVPVFHVEAGLRSYNLFEPFPEEAIRQMTTRVADLYFAPTKLSYDALLKENINKTKVFVTGNTVIDALSKIDDKVLAKAKKDLIKNDIKFNDKMVLVTVHRRENHGVRLKNILDAIKCLCHRFTDHTFIIPVHPNPNVHDRVYKALSNCDNVILTNPLDYPKLVCLIKNTKLVLTDSGGIQEEAPTFGNPVLVMRYKTERIEGVEKGYAKLVGADKKKIIKEASDILSKSKFLSRLDGTKNPYGDGKASKKIVLIIQKYFDAK